MKDLIKMVMGTRHVMETVMIMIHMLTREPQKSVTERIMTAMD